jgi:hypothetical protein
LINLPFISIALITLPLAILFYFISISFSTGVTSSKDFIFIAETAYFQSYTGLLRSVVVLPSLALVFIYFAYAIHPVFFTIKKYSKKNGNEKIVMEFEFVKKLLIIEIPLLVISIIVNLILPIHFGINLVGTLSEIIGYSGAQPLSYFFASASGAFMYAVLAVFLRIVTLLGKKEFRFYYAKGCCEIISKGRDGVQNMNYLFLLLDSYNRYLRRNTSFHIKDINKIYSLIMYADQEERNKIMKSICDSLEGNRLGLPRFLATIYKVPESDLFVKESLLQKLKLVELYLWLPYL